MSRDATDEIDDSSSESGSVGAVLSTVISPSLNSSGKSWNVLGENLVSHKSMIEPGGGGPRVSNLSDVLLVLDVVVDEKLLLTEESSEVSESILWLSGGMSKRESVEDTILFSSGLG